MAYRGDDLDLEAPDTILGNQASQAADAPHSSRSPPADAPPRTTPIWVDDTLLNCCNHAYDVASAHRAVDVRLEHVIYALTRNEAAAEILESHALSVTNLRREAATVVATEIPAAPGHTRTQPRRTEAVEEALRLAAAHAARRQAPAGVPDLLHVLLDSGREFQTLINLAPAPLRSQDNRPRPNGGAFDDLIRTGPPASYPALRLSGPAKPQNARVEALERSLHTLTVELANERQILSGVLQDLQQELMAQRDDASRLGGMTSDKIQTVFGDRLHRLEQAFHSGNDSEALEERLASLERSLHGEILATRASVEALADKPGIELGPLLERLDGIDAAISNERDRAARSESAFEDHIRAQSREISGAVAEPLIEHLNAAAATHDRHFSAASEGTSETHRRIEALEQALNTHATRIEAAAETAARERAELRTLLERLTQHSQTGFTTLAENIAQDLTEVQSGLSRVHSDHQTLAGTLDTEIQGAGAAFATLVSRVDALEKASAKPVQLLEGLSATINRMHKATVERYDQRNRFWYWLFGTRDWLGASWPSQSARVTEEMQTTKPLPPDAAPQA